MERSQVTLIGLKKKISYKECPFINEGVSRTSDLHGISKYGHRCHTQPTHLPLPSS